MCGRPHGAAVRRVRWPTNEYEYDGVWNEACARELSIFPTTTGSPPHEFQTYLNQQDGVLVPFALANLATDAHTDPQVLGHVMRMLRYERTMTTAVATYVAGRDDAAMVSDAFDT